MYQQQHLACSSDNEDNEQGESVEQLKLVELVDSMNIEVNSDNNCSMNKIDGNNNNNKTIIESETTTTSTIDNNELINNQTTKNIIESLPNVELLAIINSNNNTTTKYNNNKTNNNNNNNNDNHDENNNNFIQVLNNIINETNIQESSNNNNTNDCNDDNNNCSSNNTIMKNSKSKNTSKKMSKRSKHLKMLDNYDLETNRINYDEINKVLETNWTSKYKFNFRKLSFQNNNKNTNINNYINSKQQRASSVPVNIEEDHHHSSDIINLDPIHIEEDIISINTSNTHNITNQIITTENVNISQTKLDNTTKNNTTNNSNNSIKLQRSKSKRKSEKKSTALSIKNAIKKRFKKPRATSCTVEYTPTDNTNPISVTTTTTTAAAASATTTTTTNNNNKNKNKKTKVNNLDKDIPTHQSDSKLDYTTVCHSPSTSSSSLRQSSIEKSSSSSLHSPPPTPLNKPKFSISGDSFSDYSLQYSIQKDLLFRANSEEPSENSNLKDLTNLLLYLKYTSNNSLDLLPPTRNSNTLPRENCGASKTSHQKSTTSVTSADNDSKRKLKIETNYKKCLNDNEKAKLENIVASCSKQITEIQDNNQQEESNMLCNSDLPLPLNNNNKNNNSVNNNNNNNNNSTKSELLVKDASSPILTPTTLICSAAPDVINSYSNSKNKTGNATLSSSSSLTEEKIDSFDSNTNRINNNNNNNNQFDIINSIIEPALKQNENFCNRLPLLSITYSLSEPFITTNIDYSYFDAINTALADNANIEKLIELSIEKAGKNLNIEQLETLLDNKLNALHQYFRERIKLNEVTKTSSSFESGILPSTISSGSAESLLKRSFSEGSIKAKATNRSQSFEKFLQNIVKGKKKSITLCNTVNTNAVNNQQNTADENSRQPTENTMIPTVNQENEKTANTPESCIKESKPNIIENESSKANEQNQIQNNKSLDKSNNDFSYIPDTVRNALESAGIDVQRIIDMKTQLEMSFTDPFKGKNVKTIKDEVTVHHVHNEQEKKEKKKSEKTDVNLRSFEVRQDISAKVAQTLEDRNKVESEGSSLENLNRSLKDKADQTCQIKSNLSDSNDSKLSSNKNVKSLDTLPTAPLPPPPAPKNNRKRSGVNAARYATAHVLQDEKSKDYDYEELSSPDSFSKLKTFDSKIIPAKSISQFKPILIHKRTFATPAMSLNKLIASSSTDSFVDLSNNLQQIQDTSNNNTLDKQNMSTSSVYLDETGIITSLSNMENIGEHALKKKPSVTRSFSYNISKLSSVVGSKNDLNQNKTSNKLDGPDASLPIPIDKDTKHSASTKQAKAITSQTSSANTTSSKSTIRQHASIHQTQRITAGNTSNLLLSPTPIVASVSTSDIPNTSSLLTFSTDDEGSKETRKCLDIYHAKRKAIFTQMYDTEKSYVEALKNLVTKYYLPLKEKDIVERNLINDIFYKIPEIHVHHELLLTALKQKLDGWDIRQTIGDLLFNIFAKQSVIETYISFVNNFHTSQEAFRICKDQSSLFIKFIEQQAKDHRGKLTLKDLIIQPVQRIPRYELYIKDFLKCTPISHPDYQYLLKAQKELHTLAEKIDQVHKQVNELYGGDSHSCLQIIQDLIDNLDDLVTAYRYYIRHDMVTIFSSTGVKKDRCIFLFSDLIILTSCKRRSGNLNKRTNSIILNSPIGKQYLENVKHKLLLKFQFEDVDLAGSSLTKKSSVEKDHLEEDLNLINRITELAKIIVYPHQNLDESIKEITANITRQLNDVGNTSLGSGSGISNSTSGAALSENDFKPNQLLLTINTSDRAETLTIAFQSQDQKTSWEKCFIDTKKKFFESCSKKPASFLSNIAIPRNRSGIQFTCASPKLNISNEPNDVWICSSDGQVGQICILNTFPEFTVSSCNTVSNSKITCVLCAPPFRGKRGSIYVKKSSKADILPTKRDELPKMQTQTSTSSNKSKHEQQHPPQTTSNKSAQQQPKDTIEPLGDIESSDDEDESQSGNEAHQEQNESKVKEPPPPSQLNVLPSTNNFNEIKNSTMWIGNEDGSLIVFLFSDSSIRTIAKKNRINKQFSASILAFLYMDNKVFMSLSNCEIVCFTRNYHGTWCFDDYVVKTVSQQPITSMLAVAGRIWCSSSNSVIILNPSSLTPEHNFSIDGEKRLLLASGGAAACAVWVASQQSLDIRLYHATKYHVLAEINIKQCLTQKIMYLDELIRLHKISCLKITSIYVCKDTLWVGTSAGIIMNIKVPHVNSTTMKLTTALNYMALNHGNIGPIRFITSVEISKTHLTQSNSTQQSSIDKDNLSYKTFVIAGGEGFEEYSTFGQQGLGTLPLSNGSIGVYSEMMSNQSSDSKSIQTQSSCTNGSNPNHMTPTSVNSLQFTNLNVDDASIVGKDDLTNYVLVWEI